jgi:tRNA(fMet)-specific endonuclease VapC
MDFLADTDFLIALWREQRAPGPATAFARAHAESTLGICWVVAGEFLSAAAAAGQDPAVARRFLYPYPLVHSSPAIITMYGDLYAQLKKANALIGPNDLWIAACGCAEGIPVLTRNTREYRRVPGLQVVDFTRD